MMVKNFLILALLVSISAIAKVEVKNIDFQTKKNTGFLTIHFDGELNDYPELKVVGKTIQVGIPESKVKRKIEKSYEFSSPKKDTFVKVYQTRNDASKVKATFAFNLEKNKDRVSLTLKENKIELSFPRVKVKLPKVDKKVIPKKKAVVKKEFLNEKYLNNLLEIEKKEEKKKVVSKDTVTLSQAAPLQRPQAVKSSFSLLEYGGKFIAFLAIVLLMFYGVVVLMKKGFIKKGKLGFLNNADLISVIGQNYIAPKKSLMLIKAHNQVFLVSNTENGIHPISEIKDAAGLLKAGEKSISGTNFDTNLDDANKDVSLDVKVKIKEDISKSNQESSLSSYLNVKDKVKFSDQLKKKVKSLKPLQ